MGLPDRQVANVKTTHYDAPMRRLARWTLNALTVLSLVLSLGTAGLWVQSRDTLTSFTVGGPSGPWQVSCARGTISLRNPTTRPTTNPYEHTVVIANYEREHPLDFSGSGARPVVRVPASANSWPVERSQLRFSFAWWLFGEVGAITLLVPARFLGRRNADPQPSCNRCRYDLTGNVSGVCPECGTPARAP